MTGGPRSIALGSMIAAAIFVAGVVGCQQVAPEGVRNPPNETPDAMDDPPDASQETQPVLIVDARPDRPKVDAAVAPPDGPAIIDSAVPDGRTSDPDSALPVDRAFNPDTTAGPPGWFGPPLIVAVGQGGRRLVSVDGVTWTGDTQDAKNNTVPGKDLTGVAYANGLVVAVGGGCPAPGCSGRLMTFDGQTWKEGQLPAGQSWLGDVAYGNGLWVAAGAPGPGVSSKDGKTWTKTGSLPGGVRALAFGNVGGTNMFVAAGDNGLRVRSTDGQNWTNLIRTFPGADTPVMLKGVTIGDAVVIATGALGRRIRSTNGIDWTDPAAGGTDLGSIVFADKTFMAYASDGIVHISTDDGRNWTPQTVVNSPGYGVITGMLQGARIFVGARGAIIKTSTNGLAWNTRVDNGPDLNPINAYTIGGY